MIWPFKKKKEEPNPFAGAFSSWTENNSGLRFDNDNYLDLEIDENYLNSEIGTYSSTVSLSGYIAGVDVRKELSFDDYKFLKLEVIAERSRRANARIDIIRAERKASLEKVLRFLGIHQDTEDPLEK